MSNEISSSNDVRRAQPEPRMAAECQSIFDNSTIAWLCNLEDDAVKASTIAQQLDVKKNKRVGLMLRSPPNVGRCHTVWVSVTRHGRTSTPVVAPVRGGEQGVEIPDSASRTATGAYMPHVFRLQITPQGCNNGMYIMHDGHPFGKLELRTPALITIEFCFATLDCGEEPWDLIVDQLFEGGEDFRQVIPIEVVNSLDEAEARRVQGGRPRRMYDVPLAYFVGRLVFGNHGQQGPQESHDVLKVVKLNPTAILPSRATAGAVGFDLYANHELYLGPGPSFGLVGTGIALGPSSNFFAKVESRSGLAKQGFVVQAGILDHDHTGEVRVVVYNFSQGPYRVRIGDRIAQLVCYKHAWPIVCQVDRLEGTLRGAGSFGSTGR